MISNKCFYALRATLELAKREGSGPVTIGDIASSQQIPARFLEAILRQLKQAELTKSLRGKEGGYYLAKPAKDITVAEVIQLIDGDLVSVSAGARSRDTAPFGDVFGGVWREAQAALSTVLESTSFKVLAERDKERTDELASNYSI
ncbi:MAG: Rrf2 family transcriptional regulator [Verrucomicrobia bacterium]|nr:Rrf2 family transcriptional regulator [Verrucomicrobiota bacterium]